MKNRELPYLNSSSFKWLLCISMSVFLSIFLIIFLPFGVSNYNPDHEYTVSWIWQTFKFSLVLFLASLFNEFILKKLFIKNVTLYNLVYWSIWSFVFYGVIIFHYYNYIGNWHDYSFASGIMFIPQIASIIIFPMIGALFLFRYRFLQHQFDVFVEDKKQKIDPGQLITFAGQGQKDIISLSIASFLFAQSQDNYVELHYLDNGETSKHLIRSTLNNLQETLSAGFIIRCHRSFMVNLYQVQRIQGGITNLKLTLKGLDQPIPVSKTFASETLLHLKNYKII